MSRPGLLQTYRDEIVGYIKRKYGFTEEKADSIFRRACKGRYKPLTAVIVENEQEGLPVLKAVDLVT